MRAGLAVALPDAADRPITISSSAGVRPAGAGGAAGGAAGDGERESAGDDTDRPYAELRRLLDTCSTGALSLSDEISRRLFSHVANADHQVWQ